MPRAKDVIAEARPANPRIDNLFKTHQIKKDLEEIAIWYDTEGNLKDIDGKGTHQMGVPVMCLEGLSYASYGAYGPYWTCFATVETKIAGRKGTPDKTVRELVKFYLTHNEKRNKILRELDDIIERDGPIHCAFLVKRDFVPRDANGNPKKGHPQTFYEFKGVDFKECPCGEIFTILGEEEEIDALPLDDDDLAEHPF